MYEVRAEVSRSWGWGPSTSSQSNDKQDIYLVQIHCTRSSEEDGEDKDQGDEHRYINCVLLIVVLSFSHNFYIGLDSEIR